MKFELINLGCKVNAFETEAVGQQLERTGLVRADGKEPADVTVIFTCAVTNTAAAKSRKMIHRARRKNPQAVIAVAGCYAQIEPEALKEADILIGTAHKQYLGEYISRYLNDHVPVRDVGDLKNVCFEPLPLDSFSQRTRAFLRIQDGCDQYCAYCVIPFARGHERSMDPDQVIAEVRKLSRYHKELVLAGIHTGRYGREYHMTLTDLLKRILSEVSDLPRIRISSIEVTELSDEFVDLFCREPRIAKHLHIPLQSGSDAVLKRMGRPYTADEYYRKLEEIRSYVPDVSVSADLMTGFPGETDERFAETLSFLDRCRFSFLHVFPFSVRKGTAAEEMDGQVAPEIRKQRAAVCLKRSEAYYEAYAKSMIGRDVQVLMETEHSGYTGEYLNVTLAGSYRQGELIHAVITEVKDGIVYAGERESA